MRPGGRLGFDVAGSRRGKRVADARWPRDQTSKTQLAHHPVRRGALIHLLHRATPSSPYRSVGHTVPSGVDAASTRGLGCEGDMSILTLAGRDPRRQGRTVGVSASRPWTEIKCRLHSEKTRVGPRHGRGFDSPRLHW